MKDCPIFISSADSYADLWPVFFDLFRMHWPDYNGTIYLNTEVKSFQHAGLNIVCTQVGKSGCFGKTFRAGLDRINSDNILLMMIDYIFMEKVNELRLKEYFDFFISSDLDSLCLSHHTSATSKGTTSGDVTILVPPNEGLFSYQIAFWRKKVLFEMMLPHENPWSSEWYGSRRADKMQLKIGHLSKEAEQPIIYDPAGCLHQGKWIDNAIEYLQHNNYFIDFDIRGYYKELPPTLKRKLKVKWMLVKDGFKGSYWDLIKRKKRTI